jgi:hypothetical protein
MRRVMTEMTKSIAILAVTASLPLTALAAIRPWGRHSVHYDTPKKTKNPVQTLNSQRFICKHATNRKPTSQSLSQAGELPQNLMVRRNQLAEK